MTAFQRTNRDRAILAVLGLILAVVAVYEWAHRPRVQRVIAWLVQAWIIFGFVFLIPLAVYILTGGRAA